MWLHLNIYQGRMNIAHDMINLPPDPMFVLSGVWALKLSLDQWIILPRQRESLVLFWI